MPLKRKQQILVKVETSQGVNASPGASDAILVYEPTLQTQVDLQDRVPAGPSLSRDVVPVGRKTRTITCQSDFVGSGDTSPAITEPGWAVLAKAAGLRSITPVKVPVSTAPTGTGFQAGEVVQKSSMIRGVVLGCIVGGAFVHRLTAAGDVIVAPLEGTFTSTGTLTGESSGSTATIGTVADYAGLCYKPTSQQWSTVTVASWSPGSPAVGDVLQVKSGSLVVGSCQVVQDNGSMTSFEVAMLWGAIAAANTLTDGTNTATISTVAMSRTPSVTVRHNLDGRRRDLVGARCDFQLRGDSGGPMTFDWTIQGDPVTATNALPATTSGLSTIRPPRLLGALVGYGVATESYRIPTKSVGLQPGNQLAPNLDVNATGGSTGTNITDRDPRVNVTADDTHSGGVDWEAARDAGTAVRFFALLGQTAGNVVGIVAPNCQVMEAQHADSEGIATYDLQLRPNRLLEAGDDEFYLFQL